MSDYRDGANRFAKESNWTFWRFLPIVVVVVVVLGALGFVVNSTCLVGKTVVERKVFENSYQRSESFKARIAADEAVIVELKGQLRNPKLDENTRFNLEAQVRAARVRINSAKGRR